MITIDTRIEVEVTRHLLTTRDRAHLRALDDDLADHPAMLCRRRWNVVEAAALIALLQPCTERPRRLVDAVTKVAGVRYHLLIGIVDEPGVRCLVTSEGRGLTPWRDVDSDGDPWLTIVGTEQELMTLRAPRTAVEIAARIRRSISLDPSNDWMSRRIFGIEIDEIATFVAQTMKTNEAAGLALVRRNVPKGRRLLADARRRVSRETRRKLRALRTLYEIERLAELMRDRAACGFDIDAMLHHLSTPTSSNAALRLGGPEAMHIADGWMTMAALDASRRYCAAHLHPRYPLHPDAGRASQRYSMLEATLDPVTHRFHATALSHPSVIARVYRSITKIGGADYYDAIFGVELMRLAAVALRKIGRHCGHKGATDRENTVVLGKMALTMLRNIAPQHFKAYAQQWAGTAAIKKCGYTADDLPMLLSEESSDRDVGRALIVKTADIRRLVPITDVSEFNPWWWNRKPPTAQWSAAREIATTERVLQRDDGAFTRCIQAEIRRVGIEQQRFFPDAPELFGLAIRLSAEIGPQGTPIGTDPTLVAASMRQSDKGKRLEDARVTGKPGPKIVRRAAHSTVRLGKRAQRKRTK